MKLIPMTMMGLASMLACASGAHAANPAKAANRGGVAPAVVSLPAPRGAPVALYSQLDNVSGNGVPDQNFEASFDAYDSEAADDFVVPPGTVWLVEQVRTVGTTGTPGGSTVQVNFHTNTGALPGAIVPGCSYTGIAPTDTLGSFTINLPTACTLAAGTYWVAIQTTQNFASFGQHFWSNRTTQSNSQSVWRNPGNGFATSCLDWTAQTTCGVGGGASPDLLFEILGAIGGSDIGLTTTDTPDPVNAGSNLTYTLTSTNAGPVPADNVAIQLTMAPGTTFVSVNPSAGGVCGTQPAVGGNGLVACSWAAATGVGAANARSATVVVGVPLNTADGAVLTAAGGTTTTSADPNPADNGTNINTTVIAGADLALTLTDSPDPVTAGSGQITYTATVLNNGPGVAQDVALSLPTPAGTTFVSAAPGAGGVCATQPAVGASGALNCSWAGATAAAASRVLTVVVGVPADTANGTVFSATGTASSATADPAAGNNTAVTTTTAQTQADLSITLTDSPDPVTAGTNLTYVATATNGGPSDAQDLSISLPLPANTTLVSATGGTCVGTTCTFAGATAPGASRSVTYVVTVAASVLEGSTLTATATTASTTTDPNPANNSASTTTSVIAVADLSVALTPSVPQVLINVPVTFTAISTNGGPSDAQNVSVTITLTPDFRYSNHTAAGATCTTPQIGNTGAIVCTWSGATAPGATRTLTVVAYSNVEGNTAVNASTASATTDPVANNNLANVSVVVGYPFNEIPTLSQLGLMLLGLLVGLMGFVAVRRQG